MSEENNKLGLFLISDLFSGIIRGKISNVGELEEGETPIITAYGSNQGVSKFIDSFGLSKQRNQITVSLNGNGSGYFAYHEYDFVTNTDCGVLIPQFNMNREIGLYLVTILNKLSTNFKYGRKCNWDRLKNLSIVLPVVEGEVDFIYISSFMTKISSSILNQKFNDKINDVNIKEIQNHRLFDITEFFELSSGKYYPLNNYSTGKTPLISTNSVDNGIKNFLNVDPIFKGNAITIGKIGAITFYQAFPFVASSDVTVLVPKLKEMDKFVLLYIVTIINKEKYKWSYGRQIRLNDCRGLKIYLPIKDCGNVNWLYISNFMKSLNFSASV